jgi:hypothetical protein
MMRQIGKNFPRSDAIGVGQSVSRNGLAEKTHMIKMLSLRPQIYLDIAQRFSSCQLSKSQNQELIQATEIFDFVLCSVGSDHTTERIQRQISDHLREHKLTSINSHLQMKRYAYDRLSRKSVSSPGQRKIANSSCKSWGYGNLSF